MTEKRFTFTQDTLAKADVFDGNEFVCCTLSVWVEQLVDLLNQLNDENEQLKSTINTLTHDNTKMKKVLNTTKKENEQIKQVIKEAYNNERTQLGKSVLKQLKEAIQ